GGRLVLRRGAAARLVPELAAEVGASAAYWNRRYDAPGIAVDDQVATTLARQGIAAETFQADLLFEPNRGAHPPRVFTPFWRRRLASPAPRRPLPAPRRIEPVPDIASDDLERWALEPSKPDWAGGLRDRWVPGEEAARTRLNDFLDQIAGYASR